MKNIFLEMECQSLTKKSLHLEKIFLCHLLVETMLKHVETLTVSVFEFSFSHGYVVIATSREPIR
jgi:hypothetical protein